MTTKTAQKQTTAASAAAAPSGTAMLVQPYLFFEGRCEEAIEFYRRAAGAEVSMLMRFKDAPPSGEKAGCPPAPGSEHKIMHASFRIGSTEVLASDGEAKGNSEFRGFALSLTLGSVAEAERLFGALSDGGRVLQPLMKTFFSPRFGMLADRFGVMWMIYVVPNSG